MKQPSSAYNTAPLWGPMFMLPSQLPQRGSYLNCPEMHLVAAILEDAVNCVLRNVGVGRGRRWYEFLEARDWIMDDRRDWPFAFANVCELLTLDVTAVRESLRHVLDADQRPAAQSHNDRSSDPHGRPAPDDQRQRSGDDKSSAHERFQTVVWDEA
jgi:hypothetical protein